MQTFPQELEAAAKQAREDALGEAQQRVKVEADLLEKEIEANRKVYEAHIQSLDERIQEQNEQIEALSVDLRSALKQVHALTARALEGTSSTGRSASQDDKLE